MEEGSNPADAGLIKAFKFCVIESSIVLLEMRKKSFGGKQTKISHIKYFLEKKKKKERKKFKLITKAYLEGGSG